MPYKFTYLIVFYCLICKTLILKLFYELLSIDTFYSIILICQGMLVSKAINLKIFDLS